MKHFLYNRRILVTGGAGFIGSHIVEQLVELGAQVTVLDNLSTGKKEHIEHLPIAFIHDDIMSQDACIQATRNQDIILHLAAHVSVPQSMKNPYDCHQINVIGTLNMLEAARRNNVDRFLVTSSSAVYGPRNDQCRETDICAPTSAYGYTKYLAEQLCQEYAHLFGLSTLCLRYFNVWGERQNATGPYAAVVAKLRACMQQNIPITLHGDGQQTRDFMHVRDIAHATITLACLPKNLLHGQAVNIASGTSITLLALVDRLRHEFPGYTKPVQFAPDRPGDIKHSQADCSTFTFLRMHALQNTL